MTRDLILILNSFRKWAITSDGGCYLPELTENVTSIENISCHHVECRNCILFQRRVKQLYSYRILTVNI